MAKVKVLSVCKVGTESKESKVACKVRIEETRLVVDRDNPVNSVMD